MCVSRSGSPRIALRSCGIYSKHTYLPLHGDLRSLRNSYPRIASQSCGIGRRARVFLARAVLGLLRNPAESGEGRMCFSLGQSSDRFAILRNREKGACVSRSGSPRIASQSCGIYLKHTRPSLESDLRSLRNTLSSNILFNDFLLLKGF